MTISQIVQSVIVSGVATTYATQIAKSRYFVVPAEKSPRLTAFIISLIASAIAVSQGGLNLDALKDWTDYLTVFCGTLIVAAATYKVTYQEPKPSVVIQQNVQPEANATQHVEPQIPPQAI